MIDRIMFVFLNTWGGVNVDLRIFCGEPGFVTVDLERAAPAKERTAVASDNAFMLTMPTDG